jgi:hypothetical protein
MGNFALTPFLERPNVTPSFEPNRDGRIKLALETCNGVASQFISTPALARGKVQSIDRCRYAEATF